MINLRTSGMVFLYSNDIYIIELGEPGMALHITVGIYITEILYINI
jgi:hypothetical protein